MARLKKSERAAILRDQAEAMDRMTQACERTAMFVGKEGLWIGLQANLFIVSGRVKKDSIWGIQRQAVIDMIKTFKNLMGISIPLIDFAPFAFFAEWIQPFLDELDQTESDDAGTTFYVGVPITIRLMIVLIIPGLIRLFLDTLKGTVELSSLI